MKKWFLVAMLFICSVFVSTQKAAAQTEARSQIPLIIATLLTEKIPCRSCFYYEKW